MPDGSDRALGWDTPSLNGRSIAGDYFTSGSFGHLGFTGTSIWIDPNQKIIIILLTVASISCKIWLDIKINFSLPKFLINFLISII